MFNCCGKEGKDIKSVCENVTCDVRETEKGVQVDITAKDPSKTLEFKNLVKAFHEFCGCSKS